MSRWLIAFVLTLAYVSIAAPASAQQTGVINGTLTNALSGDAVADAIVIIEAPAFTRETRSGADGKFSIADIPPGAYHLVVRANGYLPSRIEVSVVSGSTVKDTQLSPELHFSEVTSVSPDATNQFESFQATNVLGGQDLAHAIQGTLGATIENEPGIALRSFGPGPARPVIRGLDGDRVLIVEDGLRMGDLSSQSGDHGVNVNPSAASTIEVVRGPATLLYGANAIGGLVNVISNEIPKAPVRQATGGFTFDAGSGAGESAGAGDVTVGNGRVAFHASGSGRRAGDFTSPDGKVPNSFNRQAAAEIGLSTTSDNGYFGGSYAFDKSHYGIPLVEEGETNLNPRRHIINLRGERRNMDGFFQSVRGSFGIRRYNHDELDGDVVATSFENNTTELELLAAHRPASRLKGSIGGSFLTRQFSTAGEEVLSPAVDQKGFSAFLYEEFAASPHASLQFGGRVERAMFTPEVDEPERDFTNFSGSIGLLLRPNDATTVAFSFARAARNPALEELYFHGPHPGNNAIENGNPDLEAEHALGFDASFRWRHARASGEVTFFVNSINGFIYRENSGEIEEDLPVTFFTQGDARLQGVESHADFRLGELVWVEGGLDYVQGTLTSTDQPLPRMPPLRGRAGVRIQKNAFQAGVEGSFTATQDRIYVVNDIGETETEGYNLFKLFGSYSFGSARVVNTITARLDNLTNERYVNHLNYLKDVLLDNGYSELGRNFKVVYSVKF